MAEPSRGGDPLAVALLARLARAPARHAAGADTGAAMPELTGDPGYNEAMADLAGCLERSLRALGVAGAPPLLADLLVAAIRREFQGCLVYFPKPDASNRHARNAAIRREHQRGTPVRKLAKRYRMTPATIHAILGKPVA